MTLKQLEAYYWAATCSSFAVAASRLNISVSSLSKRIAELEENLGCLLFNRSARHVTLTPIGEQLIPRARELMRNADEFRQRASNNSALTGRCRFGVGELTSLTWLPNMIAAIQEGHPGLWLEPTTSVGQSIEARLEEGDLDFAIIGGPSTRTAIASLIIGEANFTWVCSAQTGINAKTLMPTLLADHTMITLPAGAGTVRILDEWLTEHQIATGRKLSCENWGAVAGLIRQGLGIGFLPTAWADVLIKRGDLKPLRRFQPLSALPYSFQWRRDDTRPLIRKIREIAQAQIHFCAPACMV
jgi:DNA-binding transcriptional LysR family regulator